MGWWIDNDGYMNGCIDKGCIGDGWIMDGWMNGR